MSAPIPVPDANQQLRRLQSPVVKTFAAYYGEPPVRHMTVKPYAPVENVQAYAKALGEIIEKLRPLGWTEVEPGVYGRSVVEMMAVR